MARINSMISTFFSRLTLKEFIASTSCFLRSSFESNSRSESVLTCAPMAELRLIMENDKTIIIAKSPVLVEGVAPQASPMISDPRLGSRNSALEIVPSDFMILNMASDSQMQKQNKNAFPFLSKQRTKVRGLKRRL